MKGVFVDDYPPPPPTITVEIKGVHVDDFIPASSTNASKYCCRAAWNTSGWLPYFSYVLSRCLWLASCYLVAQLTPRWQRLTTAVSLCETNKWTTYVQHNILARVILECCSYWVGFNAVFRNSNIAILSKSVPTETYAKKYSMDNVYCTRTWYVRGVLKRKLSG